MLSPHMSLKTRSKRWALSSGFAATAAAAILGLLVGGPSTPARSQPADAVQSPTFSFDIDWMKLPPQWVLGSVVAVAVDRHDNVWVLHRPRSVSEGERGRAAPAVLQFSPDGQFIRGWGGPGDGYEWPASEHSLFVDDADRVWISGNALAEGASDDMVLAFTSEGRFLRQIGKRGASRGDRDTANLKGPADLFVDVQAKELFVADGYGHRRVIVFDTETGAFKRMWGAFGAPPPRDTPGAAPPDLRADGEAAPSRRGAEEFRSVHGVEVSGDGLVYVSDRGNTRIQVFDRNGGYKAQLYIHPDRPNRQTASGLALSTDPGQRWLYVADFGNDALAVVDRRSLRVIATLGSKGIEPGQFTGPHLIAANKRGDLYVAEVQGRRVQKLVLRW